MRALILVVLGTAGCFAPSYHNAGLLCSDHEPKCPAGYHCASDGACWKIGTEPSGGPQTASPDGGAQTAPGAPTGVTAESGDATATVRWMPPASDGGISVIAYVVTTTPGGATLNVGGNQLSATITGLVNGTGYAFSVAAVNAIGTGPSATSNMVTPTATPTAPSAPANVQAVNDKPRQVTITWDAPDNHGSALTGYVVSNDKDATTQSVDGGTRTAAFTNLIAGQSYSFTVTATNGVGAGPGGASSPTTIFDAPATPTGASACGISGAAVLGIVRHNGLVYRAYYSTRQDVSPTTGTQVDITSATHWVLTGLAIETKYYVVFTAVNGPFESAPTTAISFSTSKGMHDTLFYHTNNAINIVDCFSAHPADATPTRQITSPKIGGTYAAGSLFFNPVTSSIYQSFPDQTAIVIYDHVDTAHGDRDPDRIINNQFASMLSYPTGLSVDTRRDLLYVQDGAAIKVFTSASDLNGTPVWTAMISPGHFIGSISLDEGNDELYLAMATSGIAVYSSASTLAGNVVTPPSRTITISNAPPSPDIHAVWFDQFTSFVYATDVNYKKIYSFKAITGKGALTVAATGILALDNNPSGLQVAKDNLFVVMTDPTPGNPSFTEYWTSAQNATGSQQGKVIIGDQHQVFYVP
jgi:hypothetical protein